MSQKLYPSLDQALSGLCFGLNRTGLEKLQERGVFRNHTIYSLANEVFSKWRMHNDAFLMRFNDTPDGFGFVYESQIPSIEEGWNDYAQYWIEKAQARFEQQEREGKFAPRTVENLKGFLFLGKKRRLYDKTLIQAVLDQTLTFEVYQARIKHLEKLAENHIKRHAKRFCLDQIVDTTDKANPIFAAFN